MIAKILTIVVLAVVIGVDIYLFVTKKPTVSKIWNGWFKFFPFLPYACGVLAGHFAGDFTIALPEAIRIAILASFSALILAWCIIVRFTPWAPLRRTYKAFCKVSLLPMALGYVIGNLFWVIH